MGFTFSLRGGIERGLTHSYLIRILHYAQNDRGSLRGVKGETKISLLSLLTKEGDRFSRAFKRGGTPLFFLPPLKHEITRTGQYACLRGG